MAEVQQHFGIGSHFTEAYLDYWFSIPERRRESLQEILGLPQPLPMWFDYALSTNMRGDAITALLAPHLPTNAKRYLDVGCGFGGFPVAFAKLGMEAMGFEIDSERAAFAAANCLDHGLSDCVFEASVLDPDLAERFGTFDVITLIDVIEHVLDVPLTLRNVANLLNPGGIVLFEIPNRLDLSFVAHDGHLSLYGITLLRRPDAMRYHHAVYHSDNYDIGEYFPLAYYRRMLRQFGCNTTVLRNPMFSYRQLADARPLLMSAFESYMDFSASRAHELSLELRSKIQRASERYFSRALWDLGMAERYPERAQAFMGKYLTSFWTLLATKEELPR